MAGNTASSYALDAVADASPVPVVRVVQPGVRASVLTDASERFLRIATAILDREPEHLEVVDVDSVNVEF